MEDFLWFGEKKMLSTESSKVFNDWFVGEFRAEVANLSLKVILYPASGL